MDPVTIGILLGLAASGAATALGLRRGRKLASARATGSAQKQRDGDGDEIRVGTVLTHLGDEYWLAGEITFVREGAATLRVFTAPEKGGDRWVALTRDARSVWFLKDAEDLGAIGWPGVEIAVRGKVMRRIETAGAAVSVVGEGTGGAEGSGRYATFRGAELVALVAELPGRKLALVGHEVPLALVQRLG